MKVINEIYTFGGGGGWTIHLILDVLYSLSLEFTAPSCGKIVTIQQKTGFPTIRMDGTMEMIYSEKVTTLIIV